jgi:flagellar basal body-associated protein FliL
MSDTPDAKPPDATPPAAAPAKKGGGGALLMGLVLPAILAGGAAYGATRAAAKAPAHAEEPAHREAKPPGPTVPLEPFLVSVVDGSKKAHPLKLSVAVEFGSTEKEDAMKPFVPRIRDAILAHVRTLSYEDAVDSEHSEKLRAELLERCHKAGAIGAERVLITDLVSQ